MKAPQFERPDAARLRAMAAGASASMGGNSIDTMTFGPPGSKGGYGGGFGSWGKGSSGSRYVARIIFTFNTGHHLTLRNTLITSDRNQNREFWIQLISRVYLIHNGIFYLINVLKFCVCVITINLRLM